MVRSIGADHLIDYTREDFTEKDRRYDFILDNVANHSLSELRGALTPTGTLVPNGGGFDNRWFAGGGRVIGAHALNRFVSHKAAAVSRVAEARGPDSPQGADRGRQGHAGRRPRLPAGRNPGGDRSCGRETLKEKSSSPREANPKQAS
jgi:hypothetical protein